MIRAINNIISNLVTTLHANIQRLWRIDNPAVVEGSAGTSYYWYCMPMHQLGCSRLYTCHDCVTLTVLWLLSPTSHGLAQRQEVKPKSMGKVGKRLECNTTQRTCIWFLGVHTQLKRIHGFPMENVTYMTVSFFRSHVTLNA